MEAVAERLAPNGGGAEIDLTGRIARCGCGRQEPSTKHTSLAFFQYLGEGSREAAHNCGTCGYSDVAHVDSIRERNTNICADFSPKGDPGHDRFYCGCRGWD